MSQSALVMREMCRKVCSRFILPTLFSTASLNGLYAAFLKALSSSCVTVSMLCAFVPPIQQRL